MRKKFAIFLGCNIPVRLKQYESSARAVLEQLGVELTDIPDFNCCGYPLRNIDRKAFVLSSARNLALAAARNLDMLCLCQCGFGTFRMAQKLLEESPDLRLMIDRVLLKEGLKYNPKLQVEHLLGVLFHDVGLSAIQEKITRPYENLKIAVHYGCHVLRPSNVVRFDNPVAPTLFDQLVEITGAESINCPAKLDCCGGPVLGTHNLLSLDFAEKKLEDARRSGAQYLTTACPYCQIQFETVPKRIQFERSIDYATVPSILYSQLLGLAMGLDEKRLGLELNSGDMRGVVNALRGGLYTLNGQFEQKPEQGVFVGK